MYRKLTMLLSSNKAFAEDKVLMPLLMLLLMLVLFAAHSAMFYRLNSLVEQFDVVRMLPF